MITKECCLFLIFFESAWGRCFGVSASIAGTSGSNNALFGVAESADGHLLAKRGRQKVRGSAAKGVAESIPVKVKALEDFTEMIATKLFKQCIGDDRGQNSFDNHTGSGDGAGVAPLKA